MTNYPGPGGIIIRYTQSRALGLDKLSGWRQAAIRL